VGPSSTASPPGVASSAASSAGRASEASVAGLSSSTCTAGVPSAKNPSVGAAGGVCRSTLQMQIQRVSMDPCHRVLALHHLVKFTVHTEHTLIRQHVWGWMDG